MASTQNDASHSLLRVIEARRLTAPPSPLPADELLLFTHVCCPYAERVLLAILEKALPTTLVHIDLSDKPSWFRSVSARGLVPAVQHRGKVHLESADICRWLAAADEFASSGEALVPPAVADRREMERLIGVGSNVISAGLDLVAGRGRGWGIGMGQSAAQRRAFEAAIAPLEASLLQRGGPYLLGRQLTLADLLVFPFLRRFDLALRSLGEAPFSGQLAAWVKAVGSRPAARLAAGDESRWLQALRQHSALDWFDYLHVGVAELHPALAEIVAAGES